ncbi:hypothetical protein BRD17_04645 [Halobacteriales archaeon SW_7_68_16]|nr:MAG: hypothetical protein BRD17_04645 [Halobacteriales archaeon SW_7_68_16]
MIPDRGAEGGADTDSDGGATAETVSEWVCVDCGCTHPRNSPPCSRCGSFEIERRERAVGDVPDAEADGYLAVGRRDLVYGLVAILLLVGGPVVFAVL